MFLRNAWYVAAFERDVSRTLLATKMLGESIVLYRTERGDVIALENACPHRKLPLSMGRVLLDSIECGYHGLRFGPDGRCTYVPGMTSIPPGAKVRCYPTLCRYGLVWVWMGDIPGADPEKLCPVNHWDEPGWGSNKGDCLDINCNYLFITDNLLDPSHVAWVHRSSFGVAECGYGTADVEVTDTGVTVSRWMKDVEVAPFYSPYLGFSGHCDRLQHYEVRYPSHAIIRAVFVPAGTGGAGAELDVRAFIMDSYNFLTPIDERHTKYFWFQLHNVASENSSVSEHMAASVREAFEEDRRILNAVEVGFKDTATPNIDLAIDLGPLRFRRKLKKLIAAEAEGGTNS